jgi:lauroyl/myristoyl acyltransferase
MLTAHSPSLGLRAADLAAALAWPRLSPDRVQSLFPHLSGRALNGVIAHARNAELRNQVVMNMMWTRGLDPIRKLVDENPRLATLHAPVILGTFHIGAIAALGPPLERVPGRMLVLRRRLPGRKIESRFTYETTTGNDQRRALAFHRALEWLGDGNSVFIPLDPEHAARIEAPFCGRLLQFARGPFAMSRIMQVPIVPIVARWRGTRVEVVVGDPIPAAKDEMKIATATAAWLERYLLDSPSEISARILELTSSR